MFTDLLNTFKDLLTSKKFTASVAGIILTLMARFKFQVADQTTVELLVGNVIAFVLSQGWSDKGKGAAKVGAVAAIVVDAPMTHVDKIEAIKSV